MNESEIIIFLRQILWCARKERVLRGGWKRKLRGRGGLEAIVSLKTDLTCRITRYLQPIIYSIYLFLLFYKKKFYFISYQMNISNIFF